MRVSFIGAGPGDPELITVKGARLLREADIIIYAGSLVNPLLLEHAKPTCAVYDSAGMDLTQITDIYAANKNKDGLIARLHTGDPSMYGAIQEQMDFCEAEDIPYDVIPGVSSVFAAAAALRRELTPPEVSQTLILTRAAGRTPVPEKENLAGLAAHGATMALFLSAGLIRDAALKLAAAYGSDCPVRVVHKATWPDEKIITGTLGDIAETMESMDIGGQAMILVGRALEHDSKAVSKLYDSAFSHGRRQAREHSRDNA